MAPKNTPDIRIRFVANDNGYADHKIAYYDDKNEIQTYKVPARVQAGEVLRSNAASGGAVGGYEADSGVYTCGGTLRNAVDLRNGDYPTSEANRVLFTHALATGGFLGVPVRACVTLPLRDYYKRDGSINAAIKEAAIANFRDKKVKVLGSDAQPNILSVCAYAEAMCGYFDFLLTDKGELREEVLAIQGEVAIVDIGGSTTDIVSVQYQDDQLIINNGNSGTQKVGVLDAKVALDAKIREHLVAEAFWEGGHDDQLPNVFIDNILKSGKGKYAQRDWDFSDLREEACSAVAQRITSYIKTTLGGIGHYEAILVIGGGSIVFRPWLQKLMPNAIFSDEFANAKGALKYMRHLEEF